jgi:hypothetical protein
VRCRNFPTFSPKRKGRIIVLVLFAAASCLQLDALNRQRRMPGLMTS